MDVTSTVNISLSEAGLTHAYACSVYVHAWDEQCTCASHACSKGTRVRGMGMAAPCALGTGPVRHAQTSCPLPVSLLHLNSLQYDVSRHTQQY